jgi:hypothetical protein
MTCQDVFVHKFLGQFFFKERSKFFLDKTALVREQPVNGSLAKGRAGGDITQSFLAIIGAIRIGTKML